MRTARSEARTVRAVREWTGAGASLILTPELASVLLTEFHRARETRRGVAAHDHAELAKAGAKYCRYCLRKLAP